MEAAARGACGGSRHHVAASVAAAIRTCASVMGGRSGVEDDVSEEIRSRLKPVESVLRAKLDDEYVPADTLVARNVASHNFDLPKPFNEMSIKDIRHAQRGRRKKQYPVRPPSQGPVPRVFPLQVNPVTRAEKWACV